jgi:hypothetical protein
MSMMAVIADPFATREVGRFRARRSARQDERRRLVKEAPPVSAGLRKRKRSPDFRPKPNWKKGLTKILFAGIG